MSFKHITSPLELSEDAIRYQDAIDFLMERINYERRPELAQGPTSFHLDRMRTLLGLLGNPQNEVPCVHVAGSKGKGSTATMIASILEAEGKNVGLFTSPHAQRFEERFTINGNLPTAAEVVEIVASLRNVTSRMESEGLGSPTFFELATAAGWLYFQAQQVEIAVMEVGLGGRLDSTNVCRPLVCVITSISRDHTRLLGETVELIAREKAGIIKTAIPVISGVLEKGPAQVIEAVAEQQSAKCSRLDRDFLVQAIPPQLQNLQPWSFNYSSADMQLTDLHLAMPGEHQVRNAALAIAVCLELKQHHIEVSERTIRSGLSSAMIPMRIEVVQEEPLVVIDAAHNPASIRALCETLQSCPASEKRCVFASSKDKECAELLSLLNQTFDKFFLCAYQENPRSIPIEELAAIAQAVLTKPFMVLENPSLAMAQALEGSLKNELICATGSFFLAAEVKHWWLTRNLK